MDSQNQLQATHAPVALLNSGARGNLVLVCEHASRHIPESYGNLGLSAEARSSHIAWDPGALAVAREMSQLLDAKLVAGTVSRLVYDCNRPPEAAGAMPEQSEVFAVPGNRNLTAAQKSARVEQVYRPFTHMLEQTIADTPQPVLVTIHSFTRVFNGTERAVEIGILHDEDPRLADAMLSLADQHTDLQVLRNEPYGPEDGVTHTLQLHGIANGLPNVMLEVRNDLIADEKSQKNIAALLAEFVSRAMAALNARSKEEVL